MNPENRPSPDDFYPRMIYSLDHEAKVAEIVFYGDTTPEETDLTLRFLESDDTARRRIRDTILEKAINKHGVIAGGVLNIPARGEMYRMPITSDHTYESLQLAISEIAENDELAQEYLDGILLDLVHIGALTNIEVDVNVESSTPFALDSDESFDNAINSFMTSLSNDPRENE